MFCNNMNLLVSPTFWINFKNTDGHTICVSTLGSENDAVCFACYRYSSTKIVKFDDRFRVTNNSAVLLRNK